MINSSFPRDRQNSLEIKFLDIDYVWSSQHDNNEENKYNVIDSVRLCLIHIQWNNEAIPDNFPETISNDYYFIFWTNL